MIRQPETSEQKRRNEVLKRAFSDSGIPLDQHSASVDLDLLMLGIGLGMEIVSVSSLGVLYITGPKAVGIFFYLALVSVASFGAVAVKAVYALGRDDQSRRVTPESTLRRFLRELIEPRSAGALYILWLPEDTVPVEAFLSFLAKLSSLGYLTYEPTHNGKVSLTEHGRSFAQLPPIASIDLS